MKAYSLFIYRSCCIYRYTSIKIKPELKKNILKFGYGINYKYKGMLAHSFDRFYVITKFILPTTSDMNLLKFNFKGGCEYLRIRGSGHNHGKEKCILDLIEYCRKIKPCVYFYKGQIKSLKETAWNILENEITMILPKLPENRKERYLHTTYIISSFLHDRRHKALHKAVRVIDRQTTTQHNKLMHLEDSMVMFGIYNAETLENLLHTVHHMQNTTT